MSVAEDTDEVPDVIEPGAPRLENVLFVILGVLCALAVIVDLANLLG